LKRPLLLPLVPLYAAGLALREMRLDRGWERVRRLRWPVISVGNLSTGGSGKTPLVIALARLLTARGFSVDVLSRGYGRTGRGAARVSVDGTAEEFGDEPLLIAREAGVPVYVAAERYEAGQLSEGDAKKDKRPRVHILDDGFQHRQLARDVDVVLVNREDWQDNLLPAGNLREPVQAMRRASVLAIPAEDKGFESELRAWGWAGPVWHVRRRMEVPKVDGPVAAFCGIARPEQFFEGLESAGLRLTVKKTFRDHYEYSEPDVDWLVTQARSAGATALITTEKDAVRMGRFASQFSTELPFRTAILRVELADESGVTAWLDERLSSTQQQSRATI
jgi:tetraacyldisaccharide 4'-kinase